MSDLKVDGFKTSDFITQLGAALDGMSDAEKKQNINKTKGIFELEIKNGSGVVQTWTIDLKKEGKVYKGKAQPKADVTIIMADDVFVQLAEGKLDGQQAFMSGKLKTKGNMMLATKLSAVINTAKAKQAKAKL